MAQLAGVRHTYMDTTRREDLMDEIMDVSPDANYLTTTLSPVEVSQTLHEWTEYYISRDTSNDKAPEGDENTFSDLPQPVKRNNIAQNIKKVFAVSGDDQQAAKVSPKDAYARELSIAMRRWKNSAEYAVIRGTKASGASGVARETEGFINATFNNNGALATVRASGTSLSEDLFNSAVEASYNATDTYIVDLILMNGGVKRDVSKFTAGNTRNVDAEDKRLVQAIAVYESDFGVHELRAHKDMPAALLGLRKELCHVGYFRKPKHVANGVTGDNMKGHVVGSILAQADSSRSHFYVGGLRAGL